MPHNLTEQIREWDEQAEHCARQADAQTDPKVKQRFLELKRPVAVIGAGAKSDQLFLNQTERQIDNMLKP